MCRTMGITDADSGANSLINASVKDIDLITVGEYPLHAAAQYGFEEVLKTLINAGHNINIQTFDGATPLHQACLVGNIECVKILLEAGASVNAYNIDGNTPLCEACASGNVELVQLLLAHGAVINPEINYSTPLHEAILNGDRPGLVKLLLDHGANIDFNDTNFGMPLHVATMKSHMGCAELILRRGCNVNALMNHETPMHQAAKKNNTALLKLLVDFGGSVYMTNRQNKKPSDLALANSSSWILLRDVERHPKDLRQVCRLKIRSWLTSQNELSLIPTMDIPHLFKQYLQYELCL